MGCNGTRQQRFGTWPNGQPRNVRGFAALCPGCDDCGGPPPPRPPGLRERLIAEGYEPDFVRSCVQDFGFEYTKADGNDEVFKRVVEKTQRSKYRLATFDISQVEVDRDKTRSFGSQVFRRKDGGKLTQEDLANLYTLGGTRDIFDEGRALKWSWRRSLE